jgi:hypothetical protein
MPLNLRIWRLAHRWMPAFAVTAGVPERAGSSIARSPFALQLPNLPADERGAGKRLDGDLEVQCENPSSWKSSAC